MKLYGYRNGRTLRPLWTLEEAGAVYEYVQVDIMRGEAHRDWFLKINPGAKVPVLVDGDQVITESAAVCLHVAEKYPAAELLPAPGTMPRSQCYRWISFILTELDAPLWTIAKHRFALPKERRVAAVIDTAKWEFGVALQILAQRLRAQQCLVETGFSIADILAGHTLLWAKSAGLDPLDQRSENYLRELTARPAFARARDRAAAGEG
jgi:glutathione S-transferase